MPANQSQLHPQLRPLFHHLSGEPAMQTTWIVVADSSRARIFELQEQEPQLHEIEDMVNPAGRSNSNDLRSDERGRFYGKGERNQAHTADPAVTPVEHENELFAHSVAQRLEQARNEHCYSQLSLLAAPKFLGLLRANLSKEAQQLVCQELAKDVSGMNSPQLEEYLKQNLKLH
jgi:protein required for attachment to host cells